MEKISKKGMSRREFLGLSALGLTGLTILPSFVIDGVKIAPSDRVVMGFVGLGQQGLSDFWSFTGCPGVQIAAGCDVDSIKAERFRRRVTKWQSENKMNQRCDKYELFEELLNRKDIDAVSIATPDHWHALCAIWAAQSGKDVYCQKPLAYTITEGDAIAKAVRGNGRVLQMGSQQRSSQEFIQAIKMVRGGQIGHINKIYAKVGEPPTPYTLPEQDVPESLNFNLWLGPLNDPKIHYNEQLCPPVSLDPEKNEQFWGGWRWYQETGNGFTADWGAHMFDIAQAAIGMDGSGPVEFVPKGYKGTEYTTMIYANGIVMTEQPYLEENKGAQGIKFIGDNGWITVARGHINCSDPSKIPDNVKHMSPMSDKERKKWEEEKKKRDAEARQRSNGGTSGSYEINASHMQNFIDCVRSRKNPVAPVEVGNSTNTLCCLNNIARELNRPVKWDPATKSFIDDEEAKNHRLYWYQYRHPYKLEV
ncbi:MAG: Gfo/Idh/MocA family oxidoreductase [Bacteroidales bacterium]|nr:Gfo/Idh/MocA family oxidoreductase [Bacteroidales bacterium]